MAFSGCRFCRGRGCVACHGERKKYEAAETKRILNWSPPSEEDIERMVRIARLLNAGDISDDDLRSMVSAPPPLMVIKDSNDMELAKHFIGADAIKAMMEQSGGDSAKFRDAFALAAEKFRLQQRD